jgi:hypothetical protein
MLQLSYSAADEILSCEQKWVYKKVMKLEADPDANVDTLAFRFGKAFTGFTKLLSTSLVILRTKRMS